MVNKTLKADSEAFFMMVTPTTEIIVANIRRAKGSNYYHDCKYKNAKVTQDLGEKEERATLHNYTYSSC